ncbi:MAG: organic solvent tolerance protein [Polynucleobacter sp. 24-46-87]|jgi:LPS-assembly protein|uniref:LPS-assembly protein LptD n=1 Tax=unclassified Polynucleobacter TaxID=2640945 RepID=UPI000BDBFEF3|nr:MULTISPECIES: LPS assembly protein LptD [unclassified Polynucleobacter]OYY20890.1 MAG: organic solvent tolerance protein [Polynucleobacter sp. 35-46-11]OZA15882.1 MAG: organic solvent tolerance protein [Polynucleobacter sp. 24-46-87]OZA78107.1 MAG: organic solvent tolerance protein [Polynucleobacter sp. 39-46-10]
MSHYRRRAGLCAPLFLSVTLRVMMGVTLSQFALSSMAQAPAPLPPSAQSLGSSANSVLIPDRGDVTVLKLDDQLRVGKPIGDGQALTFTSSDSIDGIVDREMRLKGRAQIRRNGAVIKADEIKYDPDSDVANLSGNTEFSKGNTLFKGPKARLRVDAREGEMESPNYELRDNRARGNANKLTIETADVFVFDKATYTTCTPENLDWYFTASTLEIDNEQKEMVGTHGVMRFFDVPIAYVPYFTAPTSNQRRSGILAPVAGYNSNNGIDITQPYYVNIAPNRDLLLTPRVMGQRGVQLGAKYQFLDQQYAGSLGGDYLPYDRKTGTDRWRYDWQQRQNFSGDLLGMGGIPIAGAWTGYANMARVSDNLYPVDFSQSIAGAVTNQFRQEVGTTKNLTGSLSNWTVAARAMTFQTLQPDPTVTVQSPYNILPNITATYNNRLTPAVADASGKYITLPSGPVTTFSTDLTRFTYNVNSDPYAAPAGSPYGTYLYSQADRTVIKGAMALPQITPGYYFTPKMSFQANNYAVQAYTLGAPSAQGFVLPTFSLDSGLAFERDATELKGFFGRDMLLTMEPRAFYVYTPYQNQTYTPVFDTAYAGFGISQIFAENDFVGNDRIADNNKLTMGMTSRMIEANTGAERATVTLAQRQDFTGQKVTLGATNTNPTTYSDTLGAGSVRLLGNFSADVFGQYNTQLNRLMQTTVGGSWRPTPGRSLNFGYRNVFGSTNQLTPVSTAVTTTDQYNVSGQWPITREVSVLGRWGYDALTTKTLNTLVALEWMRDCWTLRGAYSQMLNTSQITTTQVLFQIEFRGFGSAGSNPVDIMKLNVPGYMPTSKPIPPSIYENYQ